MSDYNILLFFIFVAYVASSNGQCIDSFPNTTCKNIDDCETLRSLITKTGKTSEELNYLRKRTCGFDRVTPKICCPDLMIECVTPDGVKGQCVDIRNCSYFVSVLRCNPLPQDITFITRSRCYGPATYSVCCAPTPPIEPIHPTTTPKPIDLVTQECPANAFPPDSQSGCCGRNEDFNKISGGAAAHIDQFTWLALLEYRKHNTQVLVTNCGGALISGKYVLTAAHCVDFRGKQLYTLTSVRLGEYDTENLGPDCVEVEGGGRDCTYGAVSVPVENIIKHPSYTGGPDVWNDIALLRLARMATYNYFIRPICLPTTNLTASTSTNLRFLVAGWGAVSERQNSSPVKQIVDVPHVDINTCYDYFSRFTYQPRIWAGQMCAGGEPGKDSCRGDSGGPLMMLNEERYEMVGIVSYGSTPCGRLPGVYTNVFQYLDWISSNMHE